MKNGYLEALERIEEAKRLGAKELNLTNLGLTELPPEIAGLTKLRVLNFSENIVADLSPIAGLGNLTKLFFIINSVADLLPISGLKKLTQLDFTYNDVVNLVPIAGLKNLTYLNFQGNRIADLTPVSGLIKLMRFDVSDNLIADLSPIAGLIRLTEINISQNQIVDLTPIAGFKNLRRLYFWTNQIVDLGPIAKLQNLESLVFYENQVYDLEPIAGMTNLTNLDFEQNQVKRLTEWLLKFGKPIIWAEELDFFQDSIVVTGNPFTDPPIEIVRQGNAIIEKYFQNPRTRLGELKILLVGEGASGKTSLIRRLLDDEFDPNEDQTHGIKIRIEDLAPHGLPTTGRFWDFGGQEIMHATHKFFLSERSVYVLVLNSRKDENPDYWLRHIETYGGGASAKALILFNKCDENPAFDLDRKALKAKYPFIRGFLPVSAKTGAGIDGFRKALFELIEGHPLAESKFPDDWLAVKAVLEKDDADYIGYDGFRTICSAHGVADDQSQEHLITALNDLGVALHFKNLRGFNTQVLNPLWLTNAVYRIVNSPLLGATKGLLPLSRVGEMLDDARYRGDERFSFPREKWPFIVRIMEEFELCFQTVREAEWVVPERLPAAGESNVPLAASPGDRSVRLTVKYPEFMPTSVFPRLMVRLNHLIRGEMRWRTAMQLAESDLFAAQARITADREGRTIDIEVCGRQPRGFLSLIRKELESIRASFRELKVEEWVPVAERVSVKYDTLLAHENRNRKDYFCPELERDFEVEKLLDGIEEPEMRSDEARMPVAAFISYAHADETEYQALKKLKQHLHPFVRMGNVTLWDDGAIVPGEKWLDAIWRNFDQADIIICVLSPAFVASDFCFEKELAAALNAHVKGEKTVFPIRMQEFAAAGLPIEAIQGAPDGWIFQPETGSLHAGRMVEAARKFNEVLKIVKQRKLKERTKR